MLVPYYPPLRWCYTRRFATTIFGSTKRCNIVGTLFRIVTTLFQHCNAVLHQKSLLRIVPCNITFTVKHMKFSYPLTSVPNPHTTKYLALPTDRWVAFVLVGLSDFLTRTLDTGHLGPALKGLYHRCLVNFVKNVIREEKSLRRVAMVAKISEWQNIPKTSLMKWILTVSNLIDLIQFHLICQMLTRFSGVKSERTVSKFRKRKLGCAHLVRKAGAWN